jgi:hypothetical protein
MMNVYTEMMESEGSESSEGSRVNRCTAIQVYHGFDNGKIEVYRNNDSIITANINS